MQQVLITFKLNSVDNNFKETDVQRLKFKFVE